MQIRFSSSISAATLRGAAVAASVLFLLPAGCRAQPCTLDCNDGPAQVCLAGSCAKSAAALAFDAIAVFGTGDATATYESTTTTTFDELFQCALDPPPFGVSEALAQHYAWQGFVDYAAGISPDGSNTIHLEGGTLVVVDTWGDRCESTNAGCSVAVDWYSECHDCTPTKVLTYEGADINIYEPCGFASNLAYYRVMPQLCGAPSHFHMDAKTTSTFTHAFGNLAAGSALWHGSHTYLGHLADNILIAVLAFLNHQIVIEALSQADPNNADISVLLDISDHPRSRTAAQVSLDVSDILATHHISEWAQQLVNLDLPEYYTTFAVLVASILTIVFPQRDLSLLLDSLGGLLGADTDELKTTYLPMLKTLAANLNLTNEQKFVLFRQLLGMASKMVFAFLWQEHLIQIDAFLEPGTNEIAPDIMPPIISLLNFMTGFEHVDDDFQKFNGMYPGDEQCRRTIPHAKWHEISANALLDMAYLTDCVAAVVTGNAGSGCAHLSGTQLGGLGEITQADVSNWVGNIDINIPIIKDIVPLFVERIILKFDLNGDGSIDWADIEAFMDTVDDVMCIVSNIQDFIAMFENFCIEDSQCPSPDDFCNPLQFKCLPKREFGFFPCIKDSQCYTDECSSGYCTTLCFGSDSNCGVDQWCNPNYNPDICRPKRDNGYSLCSHDRQCKSDRCVDTSRICKSKINNGDWCSADKACLSGNCKWFKCRA